VSARRIGPAGRSRVGRDAGFTLLELLVAAAILTLIAVFSWRGLDALLRERETIASSQAIIDTTSRAFARIERDALLARDAELTEDGELRFVANPAAESASPAVAYRVSNGELLRTVNDGSAPIVLMQGLTAGTFELWVAGQGQGAGWMRQKAATSEVPPPAAPGGPAATAAQADANVPTNTFNTAAANNANVGVATPGGANNARGQTATLLQPAMASGLRIVVARADGTSLIRVFMIGGGA